jgi:RNA polymerase sigma factor (sigma-70 family)
MPDTDFETIQRILAGETQAYAKLVDRHKDRAMTLAMRLLKNRQDAEEALQDAFVRAFKALDRFEMKASFATWFYRIVFNVCSSALGKRDGTIDPAGQQRLNTHLVVCPECRRQLAVHRAIAQSAKHLPLFTTSTRFTAAVMRRVIFFEKQSMALSFLMKHGIMLALIVGLSIMGYALFEMPGWEMTKDKIQVLQPEKQITQFYTTADRQLMNQVHTVGERIIDLASEENTRLFVVAAAIIVFLALLR